MGSPARAVFALLVAGLAGCFVPDGTPSEIHTDTQASSPQAPGPESTPPPTVPPPQLWWAFDWHDPELWHRWNTTDPVRADTWAQGIPVLAIWSIYYNDGTVGVRFDHGEAHAWSYTDEVGHIEQAARNITGPPGTVKGNQSWNDRFVASWESDEPRRVSNGRSIREWTLQDPGVDGSWLLTQGTPQTERAAGHNAWGGPDGFVFEAGAWGAEVSSLSLDRRSEGTQVEVDALGTVVGLSRTADEADARGRIAALMEPWGGIPKDAVARPVSIDF